MLFTVKTLVYLLATTSAITITSPARDGSSIVAYNNGTFTVTWSSVGTDPTQLNVLLSTNNGQSTSVIAQNVQTSANMYAVDLTGLTPGSNYAVNLSPSTSSGSTGILAQSGTFTIAQGTVASTSSSAPSSTASSAAVASSNVASSVTSASSASASAPASGSSGAINSDTASSASGSAASVAPASATSSGSSGGSSSAVPASSGARASGTAGGAAASGSGSGAAASTTAAVTKSSAATAASYGSVVIFGVALFASCL